MGEAGVWYDGGAMAENRRASRARTRNLRQSVRAAQKATRRAIEELPAALRKQSTTATRPILKQTKEFGALATHPNITFGVDESGRLLSRGSIRGTARHEVAHHLGASPTRAAGHVAFRAVTRRRIPGGLTREQVPQVVRLQKEPLSRRVQRAVTALASRPQAKGSSQFKRP